MNGRLTLSPEATLYPLTFNKWLTASFIDRLWLLTISKDLTSSLMTYTTLKKWHPASPNDKLQSPTLNDVSPTSRLQAPTINKRSSNKSSTYSIAVSSLWLFRPSPLLNSSFFFFHIPVFSSVLLSFLELPHSFNTMDFPTALGHVMIPCRKTSTSLEKSVLRPMPTVPNKRLVAIISGQTRTWSFVRGLGISL